VLGASGGTGYVIEYTGQVIRDLSIEGRLTVSNMAIEHGARAGLIAPDDKTFAYVKGRPYAPKGADWDKAVAWWKSLATDADAQYDKVVVIDAADIAPSVTWGTSPKTCCRSRPRCPRRKALPIRPSRMLRASLSNTWALSRAPLDSVEIQNVFIGSCTNSRIEDLRAAAAILKAARRPTTCAGRSSCPAPAWSRPWPRTKGWT
jgi:3-isopropylmalate/(R)-2-methylmalate dehydratase large subunit